MKYGDLREKSKSIKGDDCNIKDEIIDISKHIKEKLISDNHG